MHFRAWAFAGKFSGLQIDLQIVEVLDFMKISVILKYQQNPSAVSPERLNLSRDYRPSKKVIYPRRN